MSFCKVLGIIGYVAAGIATTILTGGLAAPAWVAPVATGLASTVGLISTHLGCQGTLVLPTFPAKPVAADAEKK